MERILYEPILKPKDGKGNWFSVNGASSFDRDEAIRLASKHTSIRDGIAEIARVDEHKIDDNI